MLRYILKKTARIVIVLLGASLLTFLLTYHIKGDPAEMVVSQFGDELTKENVEAARRQLGLDQSPGRQYLSWITRALKGDFGNSYITGEPVIEELAYRFPATLTLTLVSFAVTFLLAMPIGIWAAVKKGRMAEKLIQGVTFGFMGIPSFVWGLLLAYVVSVRLKWLPMVGFDDWRYRILPAITLAFPMACRYTRMIHANLLEVLDEEYIYLLRTRGFREWVILQKSALKNAFLPVVSILGLGFGSMLGGSVVVENIFSIPGLGSFLALSINRRDYPVIQAYILLMAFLFVVINYLVDIISGFLDPRIRRTGGVGK